MKNNSSLKQIRNSALIKNPILFEAIGLCPVVAIAYSFRLAVFLAVVTAVEMIVCEVLASKFLKNVRRYWRVALYALFGVAVIFPTMYVTGRLFPDMSANFGVFLPLMAVNSLIALHCERVAVKNDVKTSFIDAVSSSSSYGAVALIVGLLREVLGNGTFWGMSLNLPLKIPGFLMPFGGLIILGFLAAGLKAFINAKYPEANPNKAFDTSEIRRSLRGSFRELMNDEFNPYGEGNEDESDPHAVRDKKKRSRAQKKPEQTTVTAEAEQPVLLKEPEHTYLDDFSEMLSDLEKQKDSSENGGEEK